MRNDARRRRKDNVSGRDTLRQRPPDLRRRAGIRVLWTVEMPAGERGKLDSRNRGATGSDCAAFERESRPNDIVAAEVDRRWRSLRRHQRGLGAKTRADGTLRTSRALCRFVQQGIDRRIDDRVLRIADDDLAQRSTTIEDQLRRPIFDVVRMPEREVVVDGDGPRYAERL